jgi:hypothetical protein
LPSVPYGPSVNPSRATTMALPAIRLSVEPFQNVPRPALTAHAGGSCVRGTRISHLQWMFPAQRQCI